VEAHISELIEVIQSQSDLKEIADWHVLGQLSVVKDGAAYYLGPRGRASALLKLSGSPSSLRSLAHHMEVVQEIHALPELDGWDRMIPKVIAHGTLGEQIYVIETMLPGIPAVDALERSTSASELMSILAQTIKPLHHQTSQTRIIDTELFDEWVHSPVGLIKGMMPKHSPELIHSMDRLENELGEALLGKSMQVSWIHGDYAPENILVDQITHQVTGIVDWELSRRNALSQIDHVWLMMAAQLRLQREELGTLVVKLLHNDKGQVTLHTELNELCTIPNGDSITLRTLILLTWLHHISSNLRKAERYRESWFWLSRNVEGVLFYL
jgi:serine/threonine protein kinase